MSTTAAFHNRGRYWSNADDVLETARFVAQNKENKYQHLLLYAHGGLNSPKDSARRIAAMKETFKDNGIYPYHFMYDTGILEELKDVISRRGKSADERAGGFATGATACWSGVPAFPAGRCGVR